jgi:uncharacterized membrane protein
MSTGRLESFSDGVIAVAATLLVLGITVPVLKAHESLGHALLHQWPTYAAYAVSFMTIGIIWINHHAMIGRLRVADHVILILNLLLLMWIAVLPFATLLMAAFLRQRHGQHLAAGVYAGGFLAMALSFAALQRSILLSKSHMLREELSLERRRDILRRARVGLLPYIVAVAVSPLSSYATLAICAAVAVFYALPISRGE